MKNVIEKDMYAFESQFHNLIICGVDEAGRGPLAGPVCAAAVILNKDDIIVGLDDSKKLSEKKRENLYSEIVERAVAYSVMFVDCHTIDEINILNATMLAMSNAVKALKITPQMAFIDGNKQPELPCDSIAIIGGDGKSASVAAASIIAKVTRDRYMKELTKTYPMYGFEIHKGYGTKAHYNAIETYGICDEHRRTFLKKIVGKI